jgi:hypothetical protein
MAKNVLIFRQPLGRTITPEALHIHTEILSISGLTPRAAADLS